MLLLWIRNSDLSQAHFGRMETVLAETMLADLRARAALVCWCKCTCCTTRKLLSCFLVLRCVSRGIPVCQPNVNCDCGMDPSRSGRSWYKILNECNKTARLAVSITTTVHKEGWHGRGHD